MKVAEIITQRKIFRMAAALSTLLVLSGCLRMAVADRELSMPVLVSSGVMTGQDDRPGLPLIKLRLAASTLIAEVASTPTQAATGLSFRSYLGANKGMLFTYTLPHRVVYHMKDTLIPLSIAYIDSMGTILEIYHVAPGSDAPVASRSNAVRFVLEVNQGWFDEHGVSTGSRIYVQ